ncbi:MAG: NADH-quinone oxidoreductase subunit M [Pseudomonadota bacterium]
MAFSELHWSAQSAYPILGVLQLLPLGAMAMMLLVGQSRRVLLLGVIAAALELLVALDLYRLYDHASPVMQFAERFQLFGPFGYHAAADGLTVLFVLLNAVLTLLVVLYSHVRGLQPLSRVLIMVFGVEATLMSLLVTVDLFWFLLMSALQLLPVGYLVWRWATSPERDMMSIRFLQFMGTGLLLLLVGTLMLGWNYADATGGGWSFDLFQLSSVEVSTPIRSLTFFLLFYGLAVRTPLFPLHGWLPLVAEHGSIAVAPVFLLGLKTGIYGMLRYVFPLMPEAVLQWHPYVVAFAVTGVFYAALLALLQVNLRRLLAFAVVSHTGVLVIGLFSLGELSFEGSVMLAVNFGLAITGLAFMSGLVYKRTGTMLLNRLGGLFDQIPVIGIAFLVAALSIVGMPGTPGFDAVHLVLEDSMHRFGALVTIAAALGNVVAAGFLLLAFQRAFLARHSDGGPKHRVEPPSALEQAVAVMVILVLLGTGFFSEPWLELTEQSMKGLSALYATTGAH